MKFIFQRENLFDDFKIELIKSKNYWDWRNEGVPEFQKTNLDIIIEGNKLKDSPKNYCPVGSIEFCLDWFNTFHGKVPKPINIPNIFYNNMDFLGRDFEMLKLNKIDEIVINKLNKFSKKYVFIKDCEIFKSEITGKYFYTKEILSKFLGKNIQITEYIPIVSEWRCFVYNSSLLDIKCYSGNPFIVPSEDLILNMITYDISSLPVSYTLDVMVGEDGVTRLLEIHDFFSCGLYGFSDYQRFPFMCYRWFNEFCNKNVQKSK